MHSVDELFEYQVEAYELIKSAIGRGNRRVMCAAPCAFGKTVLAAAIFRTMQERGKKGMFICDRIKLVQQTIKAFDRSEVKFGVMQGNHYRANVYQDMQIASVQTLRSWEKKEVNVNQMDGLVNESEIALKYMDFDVYIIDEAHVLTQYIKDLMDRKPDAIFIGLSATPYSRGLGDFYCELVVPITPTGLMDIGRIVPIKYYVGREVSVKGVKKKALKTGGRDFDAESLGANAANDDLLNGDIVKNWQKHGRNGQTIAFCASIKHSKFLVEEFKSNGITAEHIDGYMDDEMRQALFRAHDSGEIKILSCSQLLNTGYDAPQVECLIDCYPTASIIQYVQRAGRIMRMSKGKDFAVYLDHAGNVARHGPAELIVPDSLSCSDAKFNEKEQTKDKKEPTVHACPDCFQLFVGLSCECGYEIPLVEQIHTDGTELVEAGMRELEPVPIEKMTPELRARSTDHQYKAQFYGEMLGESQRKTQQGHRRMGVKWVNHRFNEWFGFWPNDFLRSPMLHTTETIKPHLDNQRKAWFAKRRGEEKARAKSLELSR